MRIFIAAVLLFFTYCFQAQDIAQIRKHFFVDHTDLLQNAEKLVDFYHDDQPDSLFSIGKELVTNGIKNENQACLHYGKLILSSYYSAHSKADLSEELLKDCIHYYEQLNDLEKLADAQNRMGVAKLNLAKNKEAITWFVKSIQTSKRIPYEHEVYMGQINLANTFLQLGDLDLAEKEIDGFISKVKKQQLWKGLRKAYDIKGAILQQRGKLEEGRNYYERSLELARKNGDQLGLSFALNNCAIAYFQTEQHNLALDAFQNSLQIRKKLNLPKLVTESFYNLSSYFFAFEKYDLAKVYADSSILLAQKNKFLKDELDGRKLLLEIAEKQGNSQMALLEAKKLISIQDQLIRQQRKEQIDFDNEINQLLDSEKLYLQRKRERILEKQLLKARKTTLYLIIGFFVLIALFFFQKKMSRK